MRTLLAVSTALGALCISTGLVAPADDYQPMAPVTGGFYASLHAGAYLPNDSTASFRLSGQEPTGNVNADTGYRLGGALGYDFNDNLPHQSSLTRTRERYGLSIFQQFFEHFVEQCIEANLVWGEEAFFDGTQVRANASSDGQKMQPRFYIEAQEFIAQQFTNELDTEREKTSNSMHNRWTYTQKYMDYVPEDRTKGRYQPHIKYKVSPVDSDATFLRAGDGNKRYMGYHVHYAVDGGRSRIILAVLTTPSTVSDNMPLLDMQRWMRFRWQLPLKRIVADTKYGTRWNIYNVEQDGLQAFIPIPDYQKRTSNYPDEMFTYVPEHNHYICPQNEILEFSYHVQSQQVGHYLSKTKACLSCSVKTDCTKNKIGKLMRRSWFQNEIDRSKAYTDTWLYKKSMRKRSVWVEPIIGEAKQWHHGRQFRLRGIIKVNIEALIRATGQNIKRLLKSRRSSRLSPTMFQILQIPEPIADLVAG